MKVFSENSDSEYPQKIFEIGRVFEKKRKIAEQDNLAAAVSPGNFTEMKQIIEYFARMLGIEIKILEAESPPPYFIDGRAGKIMLDGKEIGFIGEIHPKILRNWKMKMPVALFEISMEEIYRKI